MLEENHPKKKNISSQKPNRIPPQLLKSKGGYTELVSTKGKGI